MKVPITISITNRQKQFIENRSKKLEISEAEVIRRMLDNYLSQVDLADIGINDIINKNIKY